jgi:hypothetical protein
MHAVVVTVQVNNYDRARKDLNERVVPMVSGQPGFVSGVWLAPADGQGNSIAVFETEDQAQRMAEMVRQVAPAEVTIEDVSVREVAAHA